MSPPSPSSSPSDDPAAAAGCPVDHEARVAWLEKAREAGDAAARAPHPMPAPPPPTASAAVSPPSPPSSSSSSSWSWSSLLWSPSRTAATSSSSPPPRSSSSSYSPATSAAELGHDRVISTIPRAPVADSAIPASANPSSLSSTTTTTLPSSASHGSSNTAATAAPGAPANAERDSGTSASGHWVYPSERMFFEAMRRKQHSPAARDMAAVVPIHNAVNERAWQEIRAWEARFPGAVAANARCQGPRLASFSGDSSRRSPRARLNELLGYQPPFDRHDWVVERCDPADTVEYVIDFYQGRSGGGGGGGGGGGTGAGAGTAGGGGGLNFYLDVRPKLNTWEGCRMRFLAMLGW